jgi:uncharacterized OsmC-like protein
MRLVSRYEGSENNIADLAVEAFEDGAWQAFDLNTRSPGFLIFVYADFTCQHLYLRTNAAERGLILASAKGSIQMVTTEDWNLEKLQINFDVELANGTATSKDVDYVIERMKQCPVSKNIRGGVDMATVVHFV